MMIPKIIHFMWKDRKDPNNRQYPTKYQKYVDSWQANHPDYTFRFWYNPDLKQLWSEAIAQPFVATYQKMQHIEQCDFSRYLIMHLYGGVYVDLNTYSYQNVTSLLAGHQIAFIEEPKEHAERYSFEDLVTNSFLASVPRHPFWLDFMRYIVTNYWPSNNLNFVMINTGPLALGRFIKRYYPQVTFIDKCLAQPFVNEDLGNNIVTKECEDRKTSGNFHPVLAKHWKDTAGWGNSDISIMQQINDTLSGMGTGSSLAWLLIAIGLLLVAGVVFFMVFYKR